MEHQISQKVFVTYHSDRVVVRRIKPTIVRLEIPRRVVDFVFANIKNFVDRGFEGKDRLEMTTPDPEWVLTKYLFMKKVMFSFESSVLDIDKPLNSISVGFSDMSVWKRFHVDAITPFDLNNNNGNNNNNNNNSPPQNTPPPLSQKPKFPTAKALYAEVLKRNLACVLGSGGYIPRPPPSSIPDRPTSSATLPTSSSSPPSSPTSQFLVPKPISPKKKVKKEMDDLDDILLIDDDDDDDVNVEQNTGYDGDDEEKDEEEEVKVKKSKKRGPTKRKYTKKN